MAKYDWIALEKEYILSNHKSVSAFLKDKNIKRNGSVQKAVKGWNEKKVQKEFKKSSKTIEKVVELQSEKEAQNIVNIDGVAEKLLLKLYEATDELEKHLAKKIKKSKTVEYDYKNNKPKKETIEEIEEITSYESVIDRKGINLLAGALKNLNDIKNANNPIGEKEKEREISNIENLMVKIKEVADADTD